MLELGLIFLVTLITSATAVWVYRRVAGWHGFSTSVVGRTQSRSRMNIGLQQGFVQLAAKHKGKMTTKRKDHTRFVRNRVPKGGYKAPWGW